MCRHELEEGIYECYQRNEESDNYHKTEEPQERLDQADLIGRTIKGEVVKIIASLGEEAETTIELDGEPFCDKMQEFLKAGKSSQLVTPLQKMELWEHGR